MTTRSMIVTVNGTAYDVQVQLLDDDGILRVPAVPLAEYQQRGETTSAAAKPAAASATTGGPATPVTAPLAGSVIQIHVQVGAQVQQGQTVLTLEAMKMNTDITAPCAGVVASVDTQQGASVSEGATLITITAQG